MNLVLDTNVFNSKEFCKWLMNSGGEKYLPAVAYMEFSYHHLKKGNTQSMVDAYLTQLNVTVIPFGKEEARKAAQAPIGIWDFKENARDYAIGGTAVSLKARLVTNNQKHFQWMENVVSPEEVMEVKIR